ncbi:MAG: hypothetical protein IPQ16_14785 [Geobacteraceae bacterium]|nr:hypothetical protein [Geobacteraceae bacterium]
MRTLGGVILKFLVTSSNPSTSLIVGTVLLIWVFFGALVVIAIKWAWGFVIPKLLPGAVAQGLVVNEMPWSVAIVFSLLIVLLSNVFDNGSSSGKIV